MRSDPPRVACIITEYRPWSHADVICGRLIQGYSLDLEPRWTPVSVRALYVDQFPETDLSRALAKQYGIPIARTIREAILDGEGKLAVDGVVLIGEHGNYPTNDRGQTLYPRRRFFEETAAAFREAGGVAPVFNDKHLAALWKDAEFMARTAREMKIPFLAGSSLPLAWRRPRLEFPIGTPMDEAIAVGYGPLEAYGFHALETLQCMIERRRGGEAGVVAVECLEGKDVWEAMRAGKFSRGLLESALARNDPPIGGDFERACPKPSAFLIEHADGFRSACLMMDPVARQFLFAARTTGDAAPSSTQFWLQEPVFGHFSYLANAIVEMVRSGNPPYPVERTLLTTGVLAAAMDSRFEGHRRIETPHLAIRYTAVDCDLGAYRRAEPAHGRAGGWIDLFNGRNLDGWRENRFAGEPRWEVRDGVLIGRGGQGYLATWEEFEDFELAAEVRIADSAGGRGNSGIYFRAELHLDRKAEYPPGYEAQCDNGDPNNPTGSIYSLGVPGARAPRALARDGEWFTLRIRAEGNRLRTWVNGAPAADCADVERRHRRGAILLQLHHRTSVTEFREVRARRV